MDIKQVFTFTVVLISLFACTNKSDKNKPNIIFIIADDQGYGDLGHTGNPYVKTPALDQFSAESINLTNYHVGTTCAPTRAGIMTGRNCNRNGVWHTIMGASILNPDELTMAEVFQQNGYKTNMIGKWHLGDNTSYFPQDRGFDEAFYHGGGGVGQGPDYWNNDYFDDTYFRNGNPEKQEGYCTDVWFNEALDFMERNTDQPFFCYLSTNAPHGPFNVPEAYYNRYKDVEGITEDQKRFYAMISNLDDNFARLEAKLEELDLAENTILMYTTDNGTARGIQIHKKTNARMGYNAGMRGTKGSEYDGGHRVPMIIRWPKGGLAGGKKLNELMAHVDLLPTLAKLSGIAFTPKKKLDGADASLYLRGKAKLPERFLVTDTQRVQWLKKGKKSCVMKGHWRLVNGKELYNIADDHGQENNIAVEHPDLVSEMNTFYNQWWDDVMQEAKFSYIPLGGSEAPEVIFAHDAHTGSQPSVWNQRQIRQAKDMDPAPFFVDVKEAGTYQFKLRRWPKESQLALGAKADDAQTKTPWFNGVVEGKALEFTQAHIRLGERELKKGVDNQAKEILFELQVPTGKTQLTVWFDLKNGEKLNAYYVEVDKIGNE
ncbi:MAG: arylsulfatase [Bacteroidota bacterium]